MMFDNSIGFDLLVEDILMDYANESIDITEAPEGVLESLMIEETPDDIDVDVTSWDAKMEIYKTNKEKHIWPLKDINEILLCDYDINDLRQVANNCNNGNGVDYTLEYLYDNLSHELSYERIFSLAKFIKDNSLVILTDPAIADIKSIVSTKSDVLTSPPKEPGRRFDNDIIMMSLMSNKFVSLKGTIDKIVSKFGPADWMSFSDLIKVLQIEIDLCKHGIGQSPTEIQAHISDKSLSQSAVESAIEAESLPALEADDFDFNGGLKDIDKGINDATQASPTTAPTPKPAAPSSGSGNNSGEEVENLTNTTSDQMNQDGLTDEAGQGTDTGGDPNNLETDTNNMMDTGDGTSAPTMDEQMSPDESEDEDLDNGGDEDDGTERKRTIRKNFHKLYQILGDTLSSLESFTPQYQSKLSKYYSTIKYSLSNARAATYEILTEKINDLTVEELMKKYVICNNIYDVSARMLKEFFTQYNIENKTGKVKTAKIDDVVDTDMLSM